MQQGNLVIGSKRASRRRLRIVLSGVTCLSTMFVGGAFFATSASASSESPGVSSNKILIGSLTDLSGTDAASEIGYEQGAQARIDLQNAEGGVYGRKLELVPGDTASNATTAATATASLIESTGVFSMIFGTIWNEQAAVTAHQQDVPVVGAPIGGSAFGNPQDPFTNMVSVLGNLNATASPAYGYFLSIAKDLKVKKLAVFGFPSPADQTIAEENADAAKSFGLNNVYDNYSTPPGSTNVSALVLGIQNGTRMASCPRCSLRRTSRF